MDKKQLFTNILFNWGSFIVSIVITYALSPFVVRSLGDSVYGVWVLIMEITSYYSFIDLGIVPATGQYITRYIANKNGTKLSNQSIHL
jgi:O-antigen/teichoic acid export membrane protein